MPGIRRDHLRNVAYVRLKQLILTARLPPGSHFVERDLAAALKISRTPVREAITRLVAEGLISRRGRRGYLVAGMGTEEVAGLYAVREVLEALAVRLAAERMGAAAHRQLRAAVEAAGAPAVVREGNASLARPGLRVHDIIVRQSGNPFLYETWRRLIEKILPYMWIETLYADNAARTLREHRQLCQHLQARKVGAAEALIRDHIGRARDNLVRVMAMQVGGNARSDLLVRAGGSARRGARQRPLAGGGRA